MPQLASYVRDCPQSKSKYQQRFSNYTSQRRGKPSEPDIRPTNQKSHSLTGNYLLWRRTRCSLQTLWVIGDTYLISSVITSLPGCFWQGVGKPCSSHKHSKHSARLASTSLQLPDSVPECYSVSLGEAKGCPYKFTQAKRSTLYWQKKRRLAHVHEGAPHPDADLYDLLAFPLPFEHCSSQKSMIQGAAATLRLLQRTSGY